MIYALAWSRNSIAERSSSSLVASITSFSCSKFVALTIGAVMLGRANSQAKDTRAGVLEHFFAT
jgi:hypothetical protein